jgi:hypothetical protein
MNFQLRKISKTRGHFPDDDAAIKLLYLGIRRIEGRHIDGVGRSRTGRTAARHRDPRLEASPERLRDPLPRQTPGLTGKTLTDGNRRRQPEEGITVPRLTHSH